MDVQLRVAVAAGVLAERPTIEPVRVLPPAGAHAAACPAVVARPGLPGLALQVVQGRRVAFLNASQTSAAACSQ